jgi:hypothetical protein
MIEFEGSAFLKTIAENLSPTGQSQGAESRNGCQGQGAESLVELSFTQG